MNFSFKETRILEFYQWEPIRYELLNRLVSSVNSPVTSDTRLLRLGTILQERSEIYYEYPWWWDCVAFLCCRPSCTFALINWLVDLQCSVSCGIGSRRRAVICSGGRNRCDPKSRPKDISQCSPGACPEWKAGEWSQVGVLGLGLVFEVFLPITLFTFLQFTKTRANRFHVHLF